MLSFGENFTRIREETTPVPSVGVVNKALDMELVSEPIFFVMQRREKKRDMAVQEKQ